MADIVDKKPKVDGTGAGPIGGSQSISQPKIGSSPTPASAPKSISGSSSGPKLNTQPKAQPNLNTSKAQELSGSKIQPGSPKLNAQKTPVGIAKKPFESQKSIGKRTNKVFVKTGQPTLGVSNGISKNPANNSPNQINQNLGKGQLAPTKPKADPVRDKIISQGFAPKNGGKIPDVEIDEDYERSWGPQGDDEETPKTEENSLSKELDSGDFVNLDSGLLPYDYGFENLGSADLSVDARKNEDGKYELYFYPESENGPLPGYEPDDNDPDYVFDSFEEFEEFVNNGYKTKEQLERKQASNLFGTDLNKKTETIEPIGKDDEPGSVVVTPRLIDFTKNFLLQRGLDEEFASTVANNLHTDHKTADYYRERLKEYVDSKNGGNK